MLTLYSMRRSGNSYKARLALAQLRIPYQLVEIDILKGESHTPEFLMKNPNGQVPLLETAPGRFLAESNAILWYLAGGTKLAPDDAFERAEALQWMFFEQHSLEPNLGAAYFWLTLVKGALFLFTPAPAAGGFIVWGAAYERWFYLDVALAFALGIYLSYAGFRATPASTT